MSSPDIAKIPHLIQMMSRYTEDASFMTLGDPNRLPACPQCPCGQTGFSIVSLCTTSFCDPEDADQIMIDPFPYIRDGGTGYNFLFIEGAPMPIRGIYCNIDSNRVSPVLAAVRVLIDGEASGLTYYSTYLPGAIPQVEILFSNFFVDRPMIVSIIITLREAGEEEGQDTAEEHHYAAQFTGWYIPQPAIAGTTQFHPGPYDVYVVPTAFNVPTDWAAADPGLVSLRMRRLLGPYDTQADANFILATWGAIIRDYARGCTCPAAGRPIAVDGWPSLRPLPWDADEIISVGVECGQGNPCFTGPPNYPCRTTRAEFGIPENTQQTITWDLYKEDIRTGARTRLLSHASQTEHDVVPFSHNFTPCDRLIIEVRSSGAGIGEIDDNGLDWGILIDGDFVGGTPEPCSVSNEDWVAIPADSQALREWEAAQTLPEELR